MLFAAVVTKSLKAQEMATLPQTFEQNGVIKQIEHEDLLISIENWLSSQFNLPTINHHPRTELVARLHGDAASSPSSTLPGCTGRTDRGLARGRFFAALQS